MEMLGLFKLCFPASACLMWHRYGDYLALPPGSQPPNRKQNSVLTTTPHSTALTHTTAKTGGTASPAKPAYSSGNTRTAVASEPP